MTRKWGWFLSAFLICLVMSANPAWAKIKKTSDSALESFAAPLSDWVGSYPNVKEMLNEMLQLGLITQQEKITITEFLKEKRISSATPLLRTNRDGKKLSWGSYYLTEEEPGLFKTQDGRVLRLHQHSTFDRTFIETFRALTEQKFGGFYGVMVPPSYADTMDEVISASTWAATYQTIKELMDSLPNSADLPVSHIIVGLKGLIQNPTIECHNGEYKIRGALNDNSWKETFKKWSQSWLQNKKSNKEIGPSNSSLLSSLHSGAQLLTSVLIPTKKNDESLNSMNIYTRTWPEGKIPRCSQETALQLEKTIRDQAVKVFGQIQIGLNSNFSSISSSPNSDGRK